eukprot:TRINITY_DN218_c0_g1_i2.p1 TRINITY_DN218_c0_g1~~TRINITY_DN218_c0_g1_i2.p1  ORF type:complete len:195 (-),score=34.00 TRINITY_DN218_c0_g1_i2:173-757(-)
MALHFKQSSKNGIFPCTHPGCVGVFNTRFSWKRHQLVHKEEKEFECLKCGRRFTLIQQLKEHSYSHTKEKPFICGINGCPRSFRHASELSLHRRIHPEYKIRRYHYLKRKPEASDSQSPPKKFLVIYTEQCEKSKNSVTSSRPPAHIFNVTSQQPAATRSQSDGLDMKYLEYVVNMGTSGEKGARPMLPLPGQS